MKRIFLFITVLSIGLTACKKEEVIIPAYEKFEGTYDVKTFLEEQGTVIIKRGDSDDEIFIYVETNFITSIAPLGVYATATVDGNNYDMDSRSLAITIDLGGLSLPLNFNVDATGELSDDGDILTSEIIFTGGITGTMTSVGTKK
jgi:hypothetical protein